MISKKTRQILAPILYPVSLLYGLIAAIRNKLFDWGILKTFEFNLPVISIGNLTVGGTGKTPHVEYLLRLLSEKYRMAILSRGYMRNTKGYVRADGSATPQSIGDEPFQVFKKFGEKVEVAVDESRVHGIETLRSECKNLQGVILDDAHQHRYIKPGVSIVLIDYYRPVHDDHFLPFGNLREPISGLHRANIVIVTKVPRSITPIEKRLWIKELKLFPYQFMFFTTFQYGPLVPVFSLETKQIKLEGLKQDKISVLLLTGIANAIPLKEHIGKYSKEVVSLDYKDHKEYGEEELQEISRCFQKLEGTKKYIITTEKDAVKLSQLKIKDKKIRSFFYYLPIYVKFLDSGEEQFNKRIIEYIAKNKKINRLHK